MAGKGIVINFLSNVRDLLRGTDDAEKAFEGVADSLDDVARDGERSTERLERSFKDLSDTVRRDLPDAYRDAERASDRFHVDAGDNIRGFKEEAIQNLSEVASSFDGDLQSMADGVQGLTGGLATALTPGIGIPVAILGAAAGAWLQSWVTSTEEAKQKVSDMYRDMLESGNAFLSEDFINTSLADIIDDDGRRQRALEDAKRLGLETGTVLRATAGDQAAINELIAKANELRQAELDAVERNGEPLQDQAVKLDAINAKYDTMLDTYTGITSQTQQAVDKVNLYREATGKAATADQQRWEALGRHLAGIPAEKTIALQVDTSGAERGLREFLNKDRTIRVTIDGRSYGRY